MPPAKVEAMPWKCFCGASVARALKRARRSAAHSANSPATSQPRGPSGSSVQLYMSSAGASPNAVRSESESNSTPKRLEEWVARATRPSSMSQIMASTIASAAFSNSPRIDSVIDQKPSISPVEVIRFGSRYTARRRSRRPPRRRRRRSRKLSRRAAIISVLAPVDEAVLLEPRHHRAQLLADLLDRVLLAELPQRREHRLADARLLQPLAGEAARLDLAEDPLHL